MRAKGSGLWTLALGVFLAGAPLAARAAQPASAAEAEQRAQHFDQLAKTYRFQGGALYKTGTIQRTEASASNCTTVANAMRSNYVAIVASPSDASATNPSVALLVPQEQAAPEAPKCPAP